MLALLLRLLPPTAQVVLGESLAAARPPALLMGARGDAKADEEEDEAGPFSLSNSAPLRAPGIVALLLLLLSVMPIPLLLKLMLP